MKVCHVTSVHPPFDTRIFRRECRSLAQAGHDVTLIASTSLDQEVVHGVRIVALPEIRRRSERPLLWWHIIRNVRRIGPALVHVHDPELLLICAFLRPAKLIYDCHEPYAETVLLRDWIPRLLRRPLCKLVSILEPLLAAQTDAIIVTEKSHALPFQDGRRPIELVHNYAVLGDFELPRSSDGKTIIHVGVNSEPRGCTTIVQAARMVVQSEPQARFLIVGNFDPPSYEREIRELILAHGLEGNVVLVGRIPYADVPRQLAHSDIGLVPWLEPERFPTRVIPTKLFEYMSGSIPVIASDLPTTRQFIERADCGSLVRPGAPEELAESILYLLHHPDEAKQKGENGRRAVEQEYRWERESDKLVALYRELVA